MVALPSLIVRAALHLVMPIRGRTRTRHWAYGPISTVGSPATMTPPWTVGSPIRAAGWKPISTVVEPAAMAAGGATPVAWSPTRAAGSAPISTVGQHAGRIGPPTWGTGPGLTIGQVCMSPRRAAGGMGAPFSALWRVGLGGLGA